MNPLFMVTYIVLHFFFFVGLSSQSFNCAWDSIRHTRSSYKGDFILEPINYCSNS